MATQPDLYPAVLRLGDTPTLVVGGGAVAERKVRGLLPCGARVTLVAPEVTDSLAAMASAGTITWRKKAYDSRDMDGAEIVFVATDDEAVSRRVFADAHARHLMINVADVPELCTFYLPSVLRRGRLSIAVSTEGASPMLARRIRSDLEELFDERYGAYVDLLASRRARAIEMIAETARPAFWDAATGDEAIRDAALAGDLPRAETLLDALLDAYAAKHP